MNIRGMMILIFCFFTSLFLPAAPVLTPPATETPPQIDGMLEDSLWKNQPWQEHFRTLRSKAEPQAGTRFKMAHDRHHLYFAVEVLEPHMDQLSDMPELRKNSETFWMNDSVEINLVTDPKLESFHKLIISSSGRIQEIEMIDDNTGTNKYVPFFHWNSHARVKVNRQKDRWLIEAAIPYGSLNFDSQKTPLWRMNINRNRHTVKPSELSSFSPISGSYTNAPQEFTAMKLSAFRPDEYFWSCDNITTRSTAGGGALLNCESSFDLFNRTGRFRIVRAVLTLRDEKEVRQAEGGKEISLQNMKFDRLSIPLNSVPPGTYTWNMDLYSSAGNLLKTAVMKSKVEYQPIRIVLLRPAYRNNLYATMPDKTLDAEIHLDGIRAEALRAELKQENRIIASKQTVKKGNIHRVQFDLSGVPDGTYFLEITGPDGKTAKQRIRKLPYRKGEVWLDKNGITHVDGKRFLPVGWLIFNPQHGDRAEKGFNSHLSYNIGFQSPEAFAAEIAAYENSSLKTLIFPFQEFRGEHRWNTFAHPARAGSITDAQRRQLEKTIPSMSRNSGILAWYLADEPESRGNNNPQWFRQIRELLEELDPYHPTILLNWGVNGMQQFYEGCDILMPDCYLQYFEDGTTTKPRWAMSGYMKAAAALKRPAWIVPQVFSWPDISKDGLKRGAPPSFDELRAEFYQTLIHNGKGFQLYDYPESRLFASLRIAPGAIAREIQTYSDLLLENTKENGVLVKTTPEAPHFQAGLKLSGRDGCLIAVNTLGREVKAEFKLNSIQCRELYVAGENRSVAVRENRFTDHFAPYVTHVYLTDKKAADSIENLDSIRKKIADFRKSRKKAGNKIAIGERLTQEFLDFQTDKRPADVPGIKASSDQTSWFSEKTGSLYYLLDGITDGAAYFMTWSPKANDASPWIEITLPSKQKISKILLYTLLDSTGKPRLNSAEVQVKTSAGFRTVAASSSLSGHCLALTFPEVETDCIRIEKIRLDPAVKERALSEIEVY